MRGNQVYQALLSKPENVARVSKMRSEIERAGGRCEITPPTASGMVAVTLWLPSQYQPRDFFPDLPFYPA